MNTPLETSIKQVIKLKKHKPGRRVNRTMSGLVRNITQAESIDTSLFKDLDIDMIRSVSSSTEYELEKYWSYKIARAKDPKKALARFPYQNNYTLLVERELALLKETGTTFSKNNSILVVGSGPLPLTYIELAKQSSAHIELVDSSKEAIDLSQRFCDALDLTAVHHNGFAETITLEKQYDVILLAALVGDSYREKQVVIANLKKYLNPNGRLLARSAVESRSLLYPQITGDFKGLTLLAEHHPKDEIINSILIYKKDTHEK